VKTLSLTGLDRQFIIVDEIRGSTPADFPKFLGNTVLALAPSPRRTDTTLAAYLDRRDSDLLYPKRRRAPGLRGLLQIRDEFPQNPAARRETTGILFR
jgi:hypothetical protein